MGTIRQLITGSLRLIEVAAAGETIPAEDAADGLSALNSMLESWAVDGNKVWTESIETFNLTGGVGSYTIGSGGAFNTALPLAITAITIGLSGQDTQSLRPISAAEYAAMRDKNTALIPDAYFYNYGTPLGTIYFYNKPAQAYQATIYSEKALTAYSSVNDTLVAPAGWERALRYNLAREIAPEYGKALSADASAIAVESLRAIENQIAGLNASGLKVDDALIEKPFDILGGR